MITLTSAANTQTILIRPEAIAYVEVVLDARDVAIGSDLALTSGEHVVVVEMPSTVAQLIKTAEQEAIAQARSPDEHRLELRRRIA